MERFISLCVIVKDEAKVLRRCLESVHDAIDEIIVVDTGSTDGTIEIAKEFTEQVYSFTWINDFSAARNYAASKAQGQWILVLDADEFIDRDNLLHAINELKSHNGQFDYYGANIINFAGDDGAQIVQSRHSRIYKNNGDIEYYRAIHEQLQSKTGQALRLGTSSLMIYHTGYIKQTIQEKNKQERNLPLIHSEREQKSDEAFDLYNYGNEMIVLGNTEAALDAYIQAFKKKTDIHLEWIPMCLMNIVESLITLKRYNDALSVIRDAGPAFSDAADFEYTRGFVYMLQRRYDEAKIVLSNIVRKSDIYTLVIKSPDYRDYTPSKMVAYIYEQEKDYHNAVKYYVYALNKNRYCLESVYRLVLILTKSHTEQEVFEFLSTKILTPNNQEFLRKLLAFVLNRKFTVLAKRLVEHYMASHSMTMNTTRLKSEIITEGPLNPEVISFIDMHHLLFGLKLGILDLSDLFIALTKLAPTPQKDIVKELLDKSALSWLVERVNSGKLELPDDLNIELFISVIEKTIVYSEFDLMRALLEIHEELPHNLNRRIANLFYVNGYEDESIEFYEASDEESLSEQDYDQIIRWLISKDDVDTAHRFAKKAVSRFKQDFRFYKHVITMGKQLRLLKPKFVKKAREQFSDCEWLVLQ